MNAALRIERFKRVLRDITIISNRNKSRLKKNVANIQQAQHRNTRRRKQDFDVFVVVDFEATCVKSQTGMTAFQQEIIEFPAYEVDSEKFEVLNVFHSFVKPTINPSLSNFCSQLTGISQSDIDNKDTIEDVLKNFDFWMRSNIIDQKKKFTFITSGDWDLMKMLPRECKDKGLACPLYFYPYVNINKSFALTMGSWPRFGKGRLRSMLRLLNLPPEGTFHQGTGDCINIIQVMKALADRGHVFTPTSTFTPS